MITQTNASARLSMFVPHFGKFLCWYLPRPRRQVPKFVVDFGVFHSCNQESVKTVGMISGRKRFSSFLQWQRTLWAERPHPLLEFWIKKTTAIQGGLMHSFSSFMRSSLPSLHTLHCRICACWATSAKRERKKKKWMTWLHDLISRACSLQS